MIRSILVSLLLLFSGESFALSCVKTGTVCADAAPCKTISGVQVCLTDPAINAVCWKYTDTYNCVAQNAVDYCSAISTTSGCRQVDSVCATPGATPGSSCTRWTNTYRCGSTLSSTPTNTTYLNNSYTIATDIANNAQCQAYTDNPSCKLVSRTCAEPAATRTINGLSVYRDCWSWQDSYACIGNAQNSCAPLQARRCTLGASTCLTSFNGECVYAEKAYQCPSLVAASTVLDCGAQQYCTGGNCFNSGHVPDTDLASAVSAQETSRQAMAYVGPDQRLFGGEAGSCVHNSLGRCCDPKGGAVRNKFYAGQIFMTNYAVQGVITGSAYMYDAMYTGYNAYAAGASLAQSANAGMTAASQTGSFSYTAAFDPTSLAIAVAIVVITDLSSCEQAEKVLAQKQGAGLCRQYSSTCNGTFCGSITKRFCCFNSKLAKIINTAAVGQLGKAISDCTGLTMTEFGMLNFAAIDLGEFTAEIMANLELPASPTSGTSPIRTDVNAAIQRKLTNYYTTGRQ